MNTATTTKAAKTETFKAAQVRILAELGAQGWVVARGLKVPHATVPGGQLRLWFHPQAVYMTQGRHTGGDARSLHVDVRGLMVDALIAAAVSFALA